LPLQSARVHSKAPLRDIAIATKCVHPHTTGKLQADTITGVKPNQTAPRLRYSSFEGINSENSAVQLGIFYAQKPLLSDKMYISFEQNNAALDKKIYIKKNLFRLLQFIKNSTANLKKSPVRQ